MPVPPALSCASDGGECPCALPQYKSGERWGIVSTCGRWRIVFDDGKNALMRGEWLYTGFSPQKSHATERAQGLPVSRRRQRHLLPFPCVLRQGICSLRNYKTGGFSLCVCVVWAGKVENSFSRGFIYGGSFPDSFDSAQPRGGRFAPSSKAFATALCALPQGFCSLRNYKTGGFSSRQRRRRTKFPLKGKKLVKSVGKLPQQGAKLLKKKLLFDIITQCNATQGVQRRRGAAKGRIYGLQ